MAWKWSTNFVLLLLDPENWRCQCAIGGFPVAWKTRQSMHVTSLKLQTARTIRLYTAMLTRSASIGGLADDTYCLERSTLAMSNSEVLYAGKCCTRVLSAWHVHVVERQLFRRPPAFSAQPTQPLHVFWRGGLSQVFWQCCQFPDTFCICKPFFIARTTLTLVEGTVTKRTNT